MDLPPSKRTKVFEAPFDVAQPPCVVAAKGGNAALPKEIWQHISLFLPVRNIVRVGVCSKYLLRIFSEPDFVKHVISRPKSRTFPCEFKGNFWNTFLDEASRLVACSSILSDLTSSLNLNAMMGLCTLDIPWPELVPMLSTALLASDESAMTRASAALALTELVKLKSHSYVIPQVSTFASATLVAASTCENEVLLSALFRLLAELPAPEPLLAVKLALTNFEKHPEARSAALALIGAQSGALSSPQFPDGIAEHIAQILHLTIKAEDSSHEVLHEALAMCANLVEADMDSGSDSRGHVQRYMSSVLPALLDRFAQGAPISLIVDASLALNLMVSLIPGPIKDWVTPFVRAHMGHKDPRVSVAAMNLLGVLCEIPDPPINRLVKSFLPEILRSLEASPEKSRREAALYLVDQIPKYHISVFLPEEGVEVVEGDSVLDSLVDRVLGALSDSSSSIVQRAIFAIVNLISSLPVAQNVIFDRRYHEVFDAAVEILQRPAERVFPEIIFAVDDLLGLLIIHCSDDELNYLVNRSEQLIEILRRSIDTPPIADTPDTALRVWELNYDHLVSPEETIYTSEELVDRNRVARVAVVSSALSSTLQRLPQTAAGPFAKLLPLAIKSLNEWGFTDDNMSLLWHLFEALPPGTFVDHTEAFLNAAQKSFELSDPAQACNVARSLADIARTFMDHELMAMLDLEWVIPALLKKFPSIDVATATSDSIEERASFLLTLASVASTLGPRIANHIDLFENVLKIDVALVQHPLLCSCDSVDLSAALTDLVYSICTSLSALLVLLEREVIGYDSASLETLASSICCSFYAADANALRDSIPLGIRQDPEKQAALNRKILMLARALLSWRGADKCAQLLGKAICEAMESLEMNLDSFIEDIVEISGL
eukprot:TRINITY_DN1970_c0_g2_i1.p1 TRINITY_DN1970_c0_g2~~TRINITY_DN1970_c0_g2_i1.p1  ORF type:complete len:891 (-),score=111.43 TRINITY_DN1970_c0_g2_i1:2469-5141(-)